jgi:hypothetical protein
VNPSIPVGRKNGAAMIPAATQGGRRSSIGVRNRSGTTLRKVRNMKGVRIT